MSKKKADKPYADPETKQGLGALAGMASRKHITDACNKVGLTVELVAKTVVSALKANYCKAQLGPTGQFVVSRPFVDHPTRLKAVERAEVLLDLKPTEKKAISLESALTDDQLDGAIGALLDKGKKGKT